MADAVPPDDPRLWRQIAQPFEDAHPGHHLAQGGADPGSVAAARQSQLWPSGVVWSVEHLDVPTSLLDLICASDERLADTVTQAGLLHYGLGLRRTLSGRVLGRVERALGTGDWHRLARAETAFAALAVEPQWPLEELIGVGASDRIDGAGAALLAAAFATHGEPWRLRLGLRLAPSLHEAVLAAPAIEPRLAVRRLAWLMTGQLQPMTSDDAAADPVTGDSPERQT